jgi:3-hydroxybutyryl-CoA dehydratase
MPEPATFRFGDMQIGQRAQFDVLVTEELLEQFARLSGDYNPLHTDESYAATTAMGTRVAHGLLVASFFSRLVGMHLPGRHALYISQTARFHAPCRIGTQIVVSGEVTALSGGTCVITLHTQVRIKGSDELLVDGDAMVKLLA